MILKDLILRELLNDDSSTSDERDSARIREAYETADMDRQGLIDDVFISLTGYGLGTLIGKADW